MWIDNTAGSRVGIKIAGGLCGDGTFLSEKQKEYYHMNVFIILYNQII